MKAKELIEILQKNPELELGLIQIRHFQQGQDDQTKKDRMIEFAKVFGKLNKRRLGESEIYLVHERPGLEISLYDYATCKIVGHLVKTRIVSKPAVPVEMISVSEQYTVPVSDCQIETGEVKAEEVVFS